MPNADKKNQTSCLERHSSYLYELSYLLSSKVVLLSAEVKLLYTVMTSLYSGVKSFYKVALIPLLPIRFNLHIHAIHNDLKKKNNL